MELENAPDPPGWELLRWTTGSALHGTATEDSDTDLVSVAFEPPEAVLGFQRFTTWSWRSAGGDTRSGTDDVDWTVHGLRKFLQLSLDGNPSVVELLFAPPTHVTVCDPDGAELLELRQRIVSERALPRFLGYLRGQLKKAAPDHDRAPKWASHAVRLALQALELRTTGALTLPLQYGDADYCRRVKVGEVPVDDAVATARRLAARAEGAASVLPADPDRGTVQQWLVARSLARYR